MRTKLEQLLGWMDSAEYAPTYGELHEKVKELITEEQQVKICLIADVVCSSCSDEYAKRWDRYEINLNDKDGTSVDVSVDYCENCGHVYNMCEY